MARLERLELPTRCLEGSCSIQLSYRRALLQSIPSVRSVPSIPLKKEKPISDLLSGRSDLNRRPPAPKAGALTGLRHSPLLLNLDQL